jgi:mannose-6-phosphate isomerase-like protein (cupin superfamily)
MFKETILSKRGTFLRKNVSQSLKISLDKDAMENIFLINGNNFITDSITISDLTIGPKNYYMIINNGEKPIEINYSLNISNHQVIYNPYKFEDLKKRAITIEEIKEIYKIPNNYIETLPKWYSLKFTYIDYNLIFIKPQFGISFQKHKNRNEFWEILEGKPIILNGNHVHYFVENGTKFGIPMNTFHSVINPNLDKFVIIKEQWSGHFDEEDIKRVFNPNDFH